MTPYMETVRREELWALQCNIKNGPPYKRPALQMRLIEVALELATMLERRTLQ